MAVSIIIPTLNEEAALPATLKCVRRLSPAPDEVILVDGGSTDRTVEIARHYGVQVLTAAQTGRAAQMNMGAQAATGELLCFLHADTLVPQDFMSRCRRVLSDHKTALAGFVSVMRGPKRTRWLTTAHNYIKTWYAPLFFRPFSFLKGCRLLFGDQVLICRSDDFRAVGGFDPRQTIMEEADLCLRMVRGGRGRVRQVHQLVHSSDRRVQKWGSLRANLTYIYVGAMWGLGAPPERLLRHYRDVR